MSRRPRGRRNPPARRRPPGVESTLRIIGGDWRGRRLPVTVADGLRPTPERVRETLFNWLAPRILGARCLDLFAGTGALGIEALSRGAAHVQFVDSDRQAIASIRDTLSTLDATDRATLTLGDALRVSIAAPAPELVFIDPPFARHLHGEAFDAIFAMLAPHARVYLEYPAAEAAAIQSLLAGRAQVLREKRAGQVGYCLAQPARDGEDDGLP